MLAAGLVLLTCACTASAAGGGAAAGSDPTPAPDPAYGFPAGTPAVVTVAASDLPGFLGELDRSLQQLDADLAAGAVDLPPASGPAPAQSGSVTQLRQRADHELALRLKALDSLGADLRSDHRLRANDRSLLLGLIADSRSQLAALRATVDASADPAVVVASPQRVAGLGILGLLVPQAHASGMADAVQQYCAQRVPAIVQHTRDTITRMAARGQPAPGAARPFESLQADAATSCRQAGDGRDLLLALRTAGWPTDQAALLYALSQIREAAAGLGKVATDVTQVVQGLQAAAGAQSPATLRPA